MVACFPHASSYKSLLGSTCLRSRASNALKHCSPTSLHCGRRLGLHLPRLQPSVNGRLLPNKEVLNGWAHTTCTGNISRQHRWAPALLGQAWRGIRPLALCQVAPHPLTRRGPAHGPLPGTVLLPWKYRAAPERAAPQNQRLVRNSTLHGAQHQPDAPLPPFKPPPCGCRLSCHDPRPSKSDKHGSMCNSCQRRNRC